MSMIIWKNFVSMPIPLKLLTISALLFPAAVIVMIVSGSPVNVFGRSVQEGVWWSSGGGPITVVVGMMLYSSGMMMIKRNARGRIFFVVAWIIMTMSILFVAERLGMVTSKSITVFVSNTIWTVIIAIYLYVSKSVREYFHDNADIKRA